VTDQIPVVWVSYHDDVLAHGMWDHGVLDLLFAGELWTPPHFPTFTHHTGFDTVDTTGAVVVISGRFHHHRADIDRLNAELARLEWCLLIVTSDEESLFPWAAVEHPRLIRWVMTPRPGRRGDGHPAPLRNIDGMSWDRISNGVVRYIGSGYHPDTPRLLADQIIAEDPRPVDVSFAGQVTHERRHDCVRALRKLADQITVDVVETPGFTQGMPRDQYLRRMAASKFVACPSGPVSPDSFRLFEALEAGCVPLADGLPPNPHYLPGFWEMIFGDNVPFPIIYDWDSITDPATMQGRIDAWPFTVNTVFAWWQRYKRDLAYGLRDNLRDLAAHGPTGPGDVADQITVIIPTSVIPAHPDTAIIEATIDSIRAQADLTAAEIIVMADGVRDEQRHRAADYEEYLRRLLWLANTEWHNVLVVPAGRHIHQGNLTRNALDHHVTTPHILFVEHDTPLCGPPVPWASLCAAISDGTANVIRLHHEAGVQPEHVHLMLDFAPVIVRDVPMLRTAQWSQRPHLASAEFYRHLTRTYFGRESRTMIEDVMHGVLDYEWREHGVPGWDLFRVWLYAPDGDMKRSTHLDGRGDDPKFDMRFEYDTATPEGAPAATSTRVD